MNPRVHVFPSNPEIPTTEVAAGFRWVDTPDGRVLVAAAMTPYARHAFTTRAFGRSSRGDGSLGALAAFLEVDNNNVIRVRQIHGSDVLEVRRGASVMATSAADALVTTDPSRPVAVGVADCVPVLLADRRRRAVAAVHAGWRGTAARVVVAAVEAMKRAGVPPADVVAAVGPSIGSCCYQVDAPVHDAMRAASQHADTWFTPDGAARWRLDLWRANADQLAEAGVLLDAILVARYCTAHHLEDCFSYRKEGASAGRMFGAIRLPPHP